MDKLRVLAFDQAVRESGWAVLDFNLNHYKAVASGVIKVPVRDRVKWAKELGRQSGQVIRKYRPGVVCYENVFVGKNANTALKLAEARGVLFTSIPDDCEHMEIVSSVAKAGIIGSGGASKVVIKRYIEALINRNLKTQHEADAFMLGIWCGNQLQFAMRVAKG